MKTLIAAALIAMTCTPAVAGPDRISIMLGSHHVDARMDFHEANPGVFLTWEKKHVDFTIGDYSNSYGRNSVAAVVALPLHRTKNFSFDIFAGLAYYPKDGRYFAAHVGDVVPIGGLQVRSGHVFMQVIPSDGIQTSAIVSIGLTFALK